MPCRRFKATVAFFRCYFLKQPTPKPPKRHDDVPPDDNGSARPPPQLSVEIIERIADFLFELQPPKLDSAGQRELLSTKAPWHDVSGFMSASMDLHKMGYMRWIQSVVVKTSADWDGLLPDAALIRELRVRDQALARRHKRVLLNFSNLYAVAIDAHSDITHNAGHQFAYRDLVTAFPPSLRRLEVIHAHGPDIKLIATVKEHCPLLEHMRLGRCTIFNRPDPCDFWSSFPFDHDSYISIEGTEEYAHSLAQELAPLKNIRSLRMGLYFVPSSIVLAHRLYHRRGLPAPEAIEWQQAIPLAETQQIIETIEAGAAEPGQATQTHDPATTAQLISLLHQPDPETEFGPEHNCALCTESTSQISEDAERRANAILTNLVPSLSQIQWMAWLTPKHLGVHTYTLK
ncbi:hypothetical protein BDV93DRAFT_295031 [Ceratobasidium sp. AG-I]|nr:hypothetical protein BDV93DRAFT_295031 [Ceratobasidium sp. AG-I]